MSIRLSQLAGMVSVKDPRFGAVGDNITDDLPAFNAALAYLRGLGTNPTPRLYIPPGYYFLNGHLNVHQTVHIFGAGPQSGNINPGSLLRFPLNTWGIVFHEYRTLDDGGGNSSTPSGLGDASGSCLEGVALWGGAAQGGSTPPNYATYTNAANTDRTAHGIWIRGFAVVIRDCAVAFFGGNGIQVLGYAGATGANAGQPNLFRIENVWAEYNAGSGLYIEGSDANAGTVYGFSAISNGCSGVEDNSFLGNTHIGHHTRANCYSEPTGSGGPVGVCIFGGNTYFVNGHDKSTFASTTQPGSYTTTGASGTGSTATLTFAALASALPVGVPIIVSGVAPAAYNGTYTVTASTTTSVSYGSSATGAQTVAGTVLPNVWTQWGLLASVTWVPGLTWRCAAPYMGLTTNGVANNLWLGCYVELGHPPCLAPGRNMFVGGSIGAVLGATLVDASQGNLTSVLGFTVPASQFGNLAEVVYGGAGPFTAHGSMVYTLQYYEHADGSGNRETLSFGMDATGKLAQMTGWGAGVIMEVGLGTDTSIYGPGHYRINSLFVGPFTGNVIQIGCLDNIPGNPQTNTTQTTVGSRFYYPTVTPGYPDGMVVTVAGYTTYPADGVSPIATVQPFGRVLGATAFASLPPSPVVSQISAVNNSSTNAWGANADGAGALYALVNWNGTHWTVIGK